MSDPRTPDDRELPEELEDLDRRLREIVFRPRPSLQAKIMARLAGGGRGSDRAGPARPRWLRPLMATAAAALIGLAIWALAADGVPELDDIVELDDWLELDEGPFSAGGASGLERIDRCCADMDGGADEDDGVLIFVGPDESVLAMVVYEDRDGSGGYTRGDLVRIGPGHLPERGDLPGAGLVTLDHCCLDYDAGGPDDDGLFLVSRPPDRLLMAAVYEDRDGDGAASPGDLVRYVIH